PSFNGGRFVGIESTSSDDLTGPAAEQTVSFFVPVAMTFTKFQCSQSVATTGNGSAGATTFTLRYNGTSHATTCTTTGAASNVTTANGAFTIPAGAFVSVLVTTG